MRQGTTWRVWAAGAIVILAGIWLVGCRAEAAPVVQAPPTETAAPVPRDTATPTETATPTSTIIPPVTRTPTVTPTATPSPEPTSTPDPYARQSEAGEWTIEIPRIDLVAPIITVGWESDGAIGAPDDPDVVGWFKGGAYPGDAGNAILDGHRDWWDGPRPAIFWDLDKVASGARIFIYDDGDTHIYQVFRNVTYPYDDPDALATIEQTDEPIITLITCSGVYDSVTGNYGHRTILQARLLRSY